MTIQEIKAKAEERKEQIRELAKQKKLELELRKIESPSYEARVIQEDDIATLDAIISHAEELYAADSRKVSKVFGYGLIVNKILTVVQAIQYAKAEEKAELLAMSGLSEQLVEDILDSYGNTAYFSRKEVAIKPSIPMNIPKLKELLQLAIMDLGLVSDISMAKLNEETVQYFYDKAQVNAEDMLTNTLKYAEEDTVYEE